MQFLSYIRDRFVALIRDEEDGQAGVEYLLVLGAVVVALLIAMIALYTAAPGLVTAVCNAISGIDGTGGLNMTC